MSARVLDTLARYGPTATFFVLAEAATRHPQIVRRIVDDGRELALHGRNHRSLLTMSDRADEGLPRFDRADVLERFLTGTRQREFREPTARDLVERYHRVTAMARERITRP